MPPDAEYRVRLSNFDGPLDLLLFLIRRAEMDITDIPIAKVAEQYLAFLTDSERVDLDSAGEFLVMAATLMEIKSRMLQAGSSPGDQDDAARAPEDDPRAELVRQLLEYKRFRDAADSLESRGEEWKRRYPVAPARPDLASLQASYADAELDLEDLNIIDLVEAFRRISESVNFERLGDHQVVEEEVPIEFHAEEVVAQLRASDSPVALRALLLAPTRGEMIGRFLALLELIRERRVGLRRPASGDAPRAADPDGLVVFVREPEDASTPRP